MRLPQHYIGIFTQENTQPLPHIHFFALQWLVLCFLLLQDE